jgi:hypothetical protein
MKNWILSSVLLTVTFFTVDVEASLQLHLKFDDGSPSSTALDSSGNSSHGTLLDMNTTTAWVSGVAGQAIDFNPSVTGSERVSVNNGFDFGSEDFSVSFWVNKQSKSNAFGNIGGVAKWNTGGVPGTNEWHLAISTGNTGIGDDQPSFYIEAGTTSYAAISPDNITLGEWHHIVGVRDATFLRIYVDNILKASTAIGTASVNDVGRIVTVANFDANPRNPNATFDDIQIYDHAVSAANVDFLFRNPGSTLSPVVPEVTSFLVWSVLVGVVALTVQRNARHLGARLSILSSGHNPTRSVRAT